MLNSSVIVYFLSSEVIRQKLDSVLKCRLLCGEKNCSFVLCLFGVFFTIIVVYMNNIKVAECNLQKHLSETLIENIMKDTPNEQHSYDILYFLPVEKQ